LSSVGTSARQPFRDPHLSLSSRASQSVLESQHDQGRDAQSRCGDASSLNAYSLSWLATEERAPGQRVFLRGVVGSWLAFSSDSVESLQPRYIWH
jgi:hypothetical protein